MVYGLGFGIKADRLMTGFRVTSLENLSSELYRHASESDPSAGSDHLSESNNLWY